MIYDVSMQDFHLDDRIYDVIGEAGFALLCAEFFKRIPGDEVLAGIYPEDDLEGAEHRLREFLIQRFGGPHRYSAERGEPRLRARHMPFAIDPKARDHWVQRMDEAVTEAGFSEEVSRVLRAFFDSAATFMINRD
jgi:hemoglobin